MTIPLPTNATSAEPIRSPRPRPARPERPVAVDSAQARRTEVTGPTPSFEVFYQRERERLGRAIAFALGDVDLAAEATDEAFTRAYERWSTVAVGNPPAWVYRVAMNWSLSVLRRRKVARQHLYRSVPTEIGVVEPDVHAALAELDAKHRSVVVCRHLLGWSVAETAAALRIREGTVKSRLSRANRLLQVRLHHLRSEEQS